MYDSDSIYDEFDDDYEFDDYDEFEFDDNDTELGMELLSNLDDDELDHFLGALIGPAVGLAGSLFGRLGRRRLRRLRPRRRYRFRPRFMPRFGRTRFPFLRRRAGRWIRRGRSLIATGVF